MPHPAAVPNLPPALAAEQFELRLTGNAADVRVNCYRAAPPATSALPPLLLVHSVNAVGSAAEVAPLFEHYRATRAVYALDLPGFGLSSRTDRRYTPRLMTDAVLAIIEQMRLEHGGVPVDVLGVSLGCEFVARAQVETPASIGRIVLVSPTGFSRSKRRYGPPGSDLGQAWLYKAFTWPFWADGIYRNLTRPSVIRYFLKRTQGRKTIDEVLWAYDVQTAQQPGAKHAPFFFVSAYLFSNDINTLYEAITCPVCVTMATRGDFTDYQGRHTVSGKANWQFHAVDGGALPYFDDLGAFHTVVEPFLGSV